MTPGDATAAAAVLSVLVLLLVLRMLAVWPSFRATRPLLGVWLLGTSSLLLPHLIF